MPNQRRAFICVVLAWLIGTIVFELTATGAEVSQSGQASVDSIANDQRRENFVDKMQQQHAISELMTSSMDQMLRLAASSDLIARCDAVIAQGIASKSTDSRASSATKQQGTLKKGPATSAPQVAIVPDSMMVDPILEIMPVSKWITQVAYQQLGKRSVPVGLKRLGDKRLALDQARTSALPGLMRLLVSADRQSAADSQSEVADGVMPTSYRDRKESEVRTAVGSLVSVDKIANAGRQLSESMSVTKQSANRTQSTPRIENTSTPPRSEVVLHPSETKASSQAAQVKIETNLPTAEDIALVPRQVRSTIVNTPVADSTEVKSATDAAASRMQPPPRVASKPVVAPTVQKQPAVQKQRVSAETVIANPSVVKQPDVKSQPTQLAVQAIAPAVRQPNVRNHVQPRVDARARSTATALNTAADQVDSSITGPDPVESAQEEPAQEELVAAGVATGADEALRVAQWPFKKEAPAASGDANVTLNVQNTDVRSVLEMLARGYGMNILISPEVSGVVTANISGLSPDETLQSVLRLCNLRAQADGTAIFIYPEDSLPDDIRIVRHFQLDYARAETVEPAVKGLVSAGGNAYITRMDSNDNLRSREAIVVVDTPESVARIADYLRQADRAPRQVMIEAHVLEVELRDNMFHGVDIQALVRGDLTVQGFGLADASASVNNPLFWAQIDGTRVDSVIEALETTTDAKTLATPKLMVVNGQSSRIQVGNQLGYSTAIQNQSGSTIQTFEFFDTGVVLSVTPTISHDDRILMQVKPEVSSGAINETSGAPEAETRELETSVLLNNHQGVVIGGLIQEEDRTVIKKLPWLGDVKHVGKLFQRREAVRSRSEIIIALVPHIINMDEHPDQDCFDHEGWHTDYDRTKGPLYHGPLQRNCRPWEARLPDSAANHNHLD
jgi:type II secretory pathway component GspD/PulD (secretin)